MCCFETEEIKNKSISKKMNSIFCGLKQQNIGAVVMVFSVLLEITVSQSSLSC